MNRICKGCDIDISHLRSTAKTCSAKCRQRIASQRGSNEPAETENLQLVESTLATLVKSGLLLTPEGQLAMHLAKKLARSSKESGSSMAALSKEFHRVLNSVMTRAVEAKDPIDELRSRRAARLAGQEHVS